MSSPLFPDDSSSGAGLHSGDSSLLSHLTSPPGAAKSGGGLLSPSATRADAAQTPQTQTGGVFSTPVARQRSVRVEVSSASNNSTASPASSVVASPLTGASRDPLGLGSTPVVAHQKSAAGKNSSGGRSSGSADHGGKTASTHATPPVRRSTAAELEMCVHQCLTDERAAKALRLTLVKDAIGMVSVALQAEKGGKVPLTDVEEQFSKVSVMLSRLIENDEVKASNEALYWMKLFRVHVTKHLREIVLLTDSDKQAPAYYDNVMNENQSLLDTIQDLKNVIVDLQDELDVYREQESAAHMAKLQDAETSRGVDVAGLNRDDAETAALLELLRQPPAPMIDVGIAEDILRRLDAARDTVQDVKAGDERLRVRLTGQPGAHTP